MDTPHIIASAAPTYQPSSAGPWSPSVLTRRALSWLQEHAEAMHRQGREPREIETALARQAALWRQYGAPLPDGTALSIVRQLPGLSHWHYLDGIDPDSLADGIETPSDIEADRHRRVYIVTDWMRRHATSDIAERAVMAIERIAIEELENA